jgi:hypothetical protein
MGDAEQNTERVSPDALVRAGEPRSPRKPCLEREGGDFDFQSNPPPPTTKRRGEIAEAAFLHKAASLGFSVAKPWGESDRYDFIVEVNGRCWRVQVKSAHVSALHGYSFHACGKVRKNRYTRRDIDFIVGYVVPDDVWYVIPIEAYADKTTIKVFPSSKRRMSRFEIYREAWDYLRAPELSAPKLT